MSASGGEAYFTLPMELPQTVVVPEVFSVGAFPRSRHSGSHTTGWISTTNAENEKRATQFPVTPLIVTHHCLSS
jgi:hypothetical protein